MAIDADLAGSNNLGNLTIGHARQARFQPSVQAHAIIVFRDSYMLHFAQKSTRPRYIPAKSPDMANNTDPPT